MLGGCCYEKPILTVVLCCALWLLVQMCHSILCSVVILLWKFALWCGYGLKWKCAWFVAAQNFWGGESIACLWEHRGGGGMCVLVRIHLYLLTFLWDSEGIQASVLIGSAFSTGPMSQCKVVSTRFSLQGGPFMEAIFHLTLERV